MTKPLSLHKLLAVLLTIAAVFAGQQAFATSTFTVSSSSYNNNTQGRFKITRTGNTTIAETVNYRTVSLSAIAGKHFTEKTGTVTFNANDTFKYIYVDETAIANVDVNYRYQNGTSRKYRFEVLDKDGSLLASNDRTLDYGTGYKIVASDFDEKTLTVNSGETTAVDGGYKNNPYRSMEGSSYYNAAAPAEYLSAISAELRTTLTFQAKEVNDGYQYIQVLFDQDGNDDCDERPTSNISDGNPGTPSRSLYMAGFEHQHGSKNTTYASYSFPVTSVGNNASADAPWNTSPWNNSVGVLSIQKFKSGSDRASDGRLIAPTSFSTLDIRFNASGSGDDDWKSNNIEAHIQAVATPTVLNNYKVSGGRHQKGNTIYASVSFSEIVNITGSTRKLTTSWGDLTYLEGNGTNVLTFKGEISSSASGTFNVTGYSGTINDLAGNAFTGSISHNFGTSLDSDYVWSTSDFNSLGSDTYEIATTTDLLHLAYLVNKSSTQMNCSGLTFKQTYDITYTHGSGTSETNFTQIGGYFNSTDGDRDFCGTYDGQGHTISGIRLYKNPNNSSNVNKNVGLFGRTNGATIQNVILTDASFTGYRIVGGIVGNANSDGTVQNCLVVGSTITCGDTYAGVIVGRDPGTLTANYYRDCTVTLGGTSYTTNVGVSANSGSATQDVNGARSLHTLTIQNELVTASGESVTYQNVTYYASNTTITLAYPPGYQVTYSLNGTALSGNTFTMPATDATVDATAPIIPWTGDGTQNTPYTILYPSQLDLLAERVNSGSGDDYAADGYSGKYFALGADITYTHTTDWDDATSTENNYTAIGSKDNPFKGNFDGQNHTVSGIRIYKGGTNYTDGYQGLFGETDGGMVKRVHLADARVTGKNYVGGIAGYTIQSTVEDCTVADNVDIHAVVDYSTNHGGIVGRNMGTVQRCISHATLSVAPNTIECNEYGGVAGNNFESVKDCLATGVTVPNVSYRGAIVGKRDLCTLQRNYYRNCTVAGTANATGVGCNGIDIIAEQGAMALYTLTLPDNVTTNRTASATLPGTGNMTYTTGADIDGTSYYCQGGTVTLSYSGTVPPCQMPAYSVNGTAIEGDTFTMPDQNTTVAVTFVSVWSGNGTQNSPYLITTTAQLDALAAAVNGGTNYSGTFFKLGADITYDDTENNYTPIGTSSNKFKGTFDGDGYTVSGIHINTNGDYQGLFGYVYGGTVSNVTLRSSTITGFAFVGGIVGYLNDGSVTDCRVEGTVTIGSYNNSSSTRLGGIIGQVDGDATVNGCISAATVTDNDKSNCYYFGGIVGYLYSGTVSNNIALGANVSANSFKGAIVGYANSNNLAHNYYHDCTVGGATTNVGTPSGDVSENDGAVQVFSLSLGEGITATPAPAVTCDSTDYYLAGTTITFACSNVPAGQMSIYSVNGTAISGNTFTMPTADVTVSVNFIVLTTVVVGDAWSDDFEGNACGWEFINGDCTNAWAWGTATNNGGTHALYISNDGGTSNAYTVIGAAMVYATKPLYFTEGKFEFSFDWMANGESTYDFLRVALVPASVTLTAGTTLPTNFNATTLPTGWIAVDGGSKLNLVSEWQNAAVAVNVPAGNYYLVLAWRNDSSGGSQPPVAVDNVSITRITCEYDVTDLAVNDITSNSAILVWNNSEATQWQVAYSANSSFKNATEEIVSDTTYTMTGLQPTTTYYAKVRAYCGGEDFGAWSTVTNFLTECVALTDYPYTENFDSYTATAGFLPVCWDRINTGTNYKDYPYVYAYYSHSTSNCLHFLTYGSSSSTNISDQYAILPQMENLAGKMITLFAKGANAQSTFKIGTMTDPADVTTFTAIATQELTTSYQEFFYDVPANATDSYIAIQMERPDASSAVTRGVYIDDITIDFPPACFKPTGLVASDPTAHGATLNWNLTDETQTAWDVEVSDTTDFSSVVVLCENVDSHVNYMLTGLNPETQYYVHVRGNCGADDGVSEWSSPASFTTTIACPAPTGFAVATDGLSAYTAKLNWTGTSESYIVSYREPEHIVNGINETFGATSIPTGWENKSGLLSDVMEGTALLNRGQWYFGTSNGVFDSHAKINIYGSGSSERHGWLITPAVTLTSSTFTFDLALTAYNGTVVAPATGGTDDKFVVLITTDNEATWTILRQWDNEEGSTYVYNNIANTAEGEQVSIDLSSYVGQNVRIAFYGESTETNADNNLHIDNVVLGDPQVVPATEWQTVTVDESPAILTGLTPETAYQAKLQGNCGDDGLSEETDIINFTTLNTCPAPTNLTVVDSLLTATTAGLNWHGSIDVDNYTVRYRVPEHIEGGIDEAFGASSIPSGWAMYTGLLDTVMVRPSALTHATFAWAFGSYNGVFDSHARVNIYSNFQRWLVTPAFTLTSGTFTFDMALTKYSGTLVPVVDTLQQDDKFIVLISTDNMTTWTILREWNNSGSDYVYNTIATEGEQVSIDLSAYVGQIVYIAFYGESTNPDGMANTGGDNNLHINNVVIGNPVVIPDSEWLTAEANTTNIVLTGLTPETTYQAQVKSDCSDPEEWSNTVTFTTPEQTTLTQTVALAEGVNWFSTYLEITLEDLEAALEAAGSGIGTTIKGKTQSVSLKNNGWKGTLKSLDVAQMYRITTTTECEIVLEGMLIDPAEHPVTIAANAVNWIGYQLSESMKPADLFAGFNAVNGDVIKSKTGGTAQFKNNRWMPNSYTLTPGLGYTYTSAASESRVFTFPTSAKSASKTGQEMQPIQSSETKVPKDVIK